MAVYRPTLIGTNGDDTIQNPVQNAVVDGLAGNDSINNGALNAMIFGGKGNDTIYNTGGEASIWGGKGNDVIYNTTQGVRFMFNAGDGFDVIYGANANCEAVFGGGRNYSIWSDGKNGYTTYEGGQVTYKDSIYGRFKLAIGDPDDTACNVHTFLDYSELDSGTGRDTLVNHGCKHVLFKHYADGNSDRIIGFNETSTLSIADGTGTYATQVADDDIIVIVNYTDRITLEGAASLSVVNIDGEDKTPTEYQAYTEGADYIENTRQGATIEAFGGNDTIYNSGESVVIYAGADDDDINNTAASVTAVGDEGKDTITNSGVYATLVGGSGNDDISNSGASVSINAGSGDDTISNNGANSSIGGGADNDTIINRGSSAKVFGDAGNDKITNYAQSTTVDGGAGSDTIYNEAAASFSSINGGTGNDSITNYGGYSVTISGGEGDDSITNEYGFNITIEAGAGNDYINLESADAQKHLIKYADGDGFDVIYGFAAQDTLEINDGYGTYSKEIDGNDVIVTVGDGKITLVGVANLEAINISGKDKKSLLITGTESADNISNTVNSATIQALDGNDTVSNNGGDSVSIDGGAGDDNITSHASNVIIDGGSGNDTIYNYYGSPNVTISGGTGNDYINNVVGNSENVLFKYTSGDGNDTIIGFNETSMLSISGGEFSTAQSGNDVIVTVNDGQIILKNSANLSAVNISGQKKASVNPLFISLTEDDDDYTNSLESATILALGGSDKITNTSDSVTIDGGADDDYINNVGDNSSISGSDGNDYIYSYGVNVTITGGADDDYIYVYNDGDNSSILGGDGNDEIYNDGDSVTIDGGTGNDSIYNDGDNSSISGGDGNDSIDNFGNLVTVAGGTGNDSIYNGGSFLGDDYFSGGDNSSISGGDGNDEIYNNGNNVTIDGGSGDDYIYNGGYSDSLYPYSSGASVSIEGGTGNDTIDNYGDSISTADGTYVTINGGGDNDLIRNFGGANSTLLGGAGNDTIYNHGIVTFDENNHSVESSAIEAEVFVDGGAGDDYIENENHATTITGGAGNDSIRNEGANISFNYKTGDGNDTIWGFNETSTLKIDDGTGNYSTEINGNDIIVTIGEGSITLVDAASLSAVEILGEDKSTPVWVLSGTTATYGTSNKVLITVSGIKSLDGISLKDNVVTLSAKSLGADKVTISEGYTLNLDADVPISQTTEAGWTLNGSTASYKTAATSAGYKLNGNQIDYVPASGGETLFALNGLKSTDGVTVTSDGTSHTVKLTETALNSATGTTITLDKILTEVKLAFADNFTGNTKETVDKAANLNNGTYAATTYAKWYELKDNSITIHPASTPETFQITGLGSAASLGKNIFVSNGKVRIMAGALAENHSKISLGTTDYTLELDDDVAQVKKINFKHSGNDVTLAGTTAGYKLVNGSYEWQSQSGGETFTITGLKNGASLTADMFTTIDGKITFKPTDAVVPEEPSTITISGDNNVIDTTGLKSTAALSAKWNNNTYISAKTASSWTSGTNSVKYTPATGGVNQFTVSGLKSGADITALTPDAKGNINLTKELMPDATAKNLKLENIISGGNYKFVLPSDAKLATSGETVAATFMGKNGTYNYSSAYNKEYYSGSSTDISYNSATIPTTFTISGLKPGLTLGKEIMVNDNSGTVTLTADAVDVSNIVLTDSTGTYKKLTLPAALTTKNSHGATFTSNGTTFVYKGAYTDAYFSGSGTSYKYNKESAAETFEVTNLNAKSDKSALLSAFNASNKTLTLTDSYLTGTDVTISKGYKLALDKDYAPKQTKAEGFDGLTYKTATFSAGYIASGNKITYTAASGGNSLFTLTGVKNTTGVQVDTSKKTVTLTANNLSQKDVTVDGGYSLKLSEDVDTVKEKITAWTTLQSGNVAYLENGTGEYYSLNGNKTALNYNASVAGAKKVELSGVKGTPTLKSGVVVLKPTNFNGNMSVVSNAGGYSFNLGGKVAGKTFTGTAKADTIKSNASKLIIDAGKGNDSITNSGVNVSITGGAGNDKVTIGNGSTFIYAKGDGKDILYQFSDTDKIKLTNTTAKAKISGKDVVFTTNGGSITVKDAAQGNKIQLVDAEDKILSAYTYSSDGIADGKSITLQAGFSGTFDAEKFTKVDGSDVAKKIKINGGSSASTLTGGAGADTISGGKKNDNLVGNAGNDKLYGNAGNDSLLGGSGKDLLDGGKGNDLLTGGKGKDTFVFSGGKDTITDYTTGEDTISISGSLGKGSYKISKKNVTLTYGSNSLTIINGLNKKMKFADGTTGTYTTQAFLDDKKTAVTLPSASKTFKATSLLVTIDGSAATSAINITGNKKANYIVAGNKGSTLSGGDGNDILLGGKGKDSLVGGNGNDSLFGGSGNDILLGGKGNDTLWGGAGNDSLYGGSGNDTFIYKPGEGTDKIFDYQSGDILTILKKNGKSGGTFSKAIFSGDELTLAISGGGKVIFDGVSKGDVININGKNRTISGKTLK